MSALHPAVQYLTALFEPEDVLCLTFISGTKTYSHGGAVTENKFVPMANVITEAGIKRLTQRNAEDHVYVSMATFKPESKNRTKANIAKAAHVFIEADENGEAVLAAVRTSVAAGEVPAPTIILESSPGKFQFIWNVDGFDVPLQEAMNKTLQQRFGTDPQSVDAARVLRIAGFKNIKAKYADPKPIATVIEHNKSFMPLEPGDFTIPLAVEPDDPSKYVAVDDEIVKQKIELLRAAMEAAAVGHAPLEPWAGSGGAFKFVLNVCPWSDTHTNGNLSDAMAFVQPNGAYGFKCLHAHCADKEWENFRAYLEKLAGRKLQFAVKPPKPTPPPATPPKPPTPKSLGAASTTSFTESGTSPTPPKAVKAATSSAPVNGDMKLNLVPLSSVEPEIQEWLWENRIPKSALTNLSGDADKGKSLVLYDILSRISNGADFPDGAKNPYDGQPKKALLMFAEGSLKTTVVPRMMVMGANMDNINVIKSVSRKGEQDSAKRQFYLETDLKLLREELKHNPDIVAIGFDPMTNYLGDNCNMNKSQDVRRVLTPLCELAEECGVAVIAILHFNKATGMNAMNRAGGAAALVELPRAAWCCVEDPDNKGGFLLLRIKGNLGKRIGGLSYRIDETFLPIRGKQSSQPQLVWGTATERTADVVLGMQNDPELKSMGKARAWLEETFKDGKARKSTAVYAAALAVGITEDCLKKARAGLRMPSKKIEWQWYMRGPQGESQPWVIVDDLTPTGDSDSDV